MLLGIKKTPQAGKPDALEVFYIGHDGAALTKAHTQLVKENKDGAARFVMLRNPTTIPLACVETSTEEHPDNIAAQKRQAELAKSAQNKATQPELSPESALAKKSKAELLALAEAAKLTVDDKATKAEIISLLSQPK